MQVLKRNRAVNNVARGGQLPRMTVTAPASVVAAASAERASKRDDYARLMWFQRTVCRNSSRNFVMTLLINPRAGDGR
jgi:hypothetical protein